MDKATNMQAQQRKGRMIFILMAIFFVVPIVVVVAMYKFNWKPSGQSLGELVRPARLITFEEQDSTLKFWNEKWNIVYVADTCGKVCLEKVKDMRQIHVSTYKDILRVQRVLITQQQDVEAIKKDYPDMIILNQPNEAIARLANQFNINNENALVANRTYLVDPLGHIMMTYQTQQPAANIRKDLVRLLKFSWAG